MYAACHTNSVPVHYSQNYLIDAVLSAPHNIPTTSDVSSTFTASGSASGVDFVVASFGTGAARVSLPSLVGFTSYACKLKGTDRLDLTIPLIENASAGAGVVFETVSGSYSDLLDSTVRVTHIALCDSAVTFSANNASNVMQGNEVIVNFISSCNSALRFSAAGIMPDWDSNKLEAQAIDTLGAPGTVRVLDNQSGGAVPRVTFICESWFGGWVSASHVIINGAFNALDFRANFASTPIDGQFVLTGVDNKIDVKSKEWKSLAYWIPQTAAANKAAFKAANGGLIPWRNSFKVQITLASDLVSGATRQFYVYHQLTDGLSNRLSYRPGEANMQGIIMTFLIDQSAINANEVTFVIANALGTTLTAGTVISFYIDIGV
jgi:hypothetical protein